MTFGVESGIQLDDDSTLEVLQDPATRLAEMHEAGWEGCGETRLRWSAVYVPAT
jgi:hypothetical protein